MAFLIKVVVERGGKGRELLERLQLPEPEHSSQPSSEGQVAVFCAVVGSATDLLLGVPSNVRHGRRVGSYLARCDRYRRSLAACA